MVCTIISLLILTDWQAMCHDPCTDYSLFHHPELIEEYKSQLTAFNSSVSDDLSTRSLSDVDKDVYHIAVSRCLSAVGDQCHWIPHSLLTHKHCHDCQPICRSTEHTLTFAQFIIGILLLISTLPLMYTGLFLLLSNSVSLSLQVYTIHIEIYCYLYDLQGICFGVMVALRVLMRSTASIWSKIHLKRRES